MNNKEKKNKNWNFLPLKLALV